MVLPTASQLNVRWDTNTAVAVIVLSALAFLWMVDRGFRGFVVRVGEA